MKALLGIEYRGEPDQVLLIAAAPVAKDEETARFEAGGALNEG